MAQYRKESLETGLYYHIFSRSIAKYVVFNNQEDYSRFFEIVNLCSYKDFDFRYSKFVQLKLSTQIEIIKNLKNCSDVLVEMLSYCFMPTHFHLILKQMDNHGISNFIARVLNCYSKYFNIKHKRTGPLWSGRFKSVLVSNDNQLLHLTRYIHLNPTSANLVERPEDWTNSSYNEYINPDHVATKICKFENIIDVNPVTYKKFVTDRKDYQRQISLIKNLLIDDYTG